MHRTRLLLLLGFVFLLVSISIVALHGQSLAEEEKDYYYEFINVDIDILADSTMQVTETQKFVYKLASFHYGERSIPLDKVDSIEHIVVYEEDRQYQLNPAVREWIDTRKKTGRSPGGDTYAYYTWVEDYNLRIGWWFPRTTGGSRTFTIKYEVKGGIGIGEDRDWLPWTVAFKDRDVPVMGAKVTVHLPEPIPAEQFKIGALLSGEASILLDTQEKVVDDRSIEFTASRMDPGTGVVIYVSFPHGIVAGEKPSWQGKKSSWQVEGGKGRSVASWFGLVIFSATVFMLALAALGALAYKTPLRKYRPVERWGPFGWEFLIRFFRGGNGGGGGGGGGG